MTLHVFFCFPETAGKTLEEVEEMFKSGRPPWKTGVRRDITAKERGNVGADDEKKEPTDEEKAREEQLRQALEESRAQDAGVEDTRVEDTRGEDTRVEDLLANQTRVEERPAWSLHHDHH